jgi:subtilisin family serine protease
VSATEVIVTLDAPAALAGPAQTTAGLDSARRRVDVSQARAAASLRRAIPGVRIVERYRLIANAFALVLPKRDLGRLAKVPGIAKVWQNATYPALTVSRTFVRRAQALTQGPQVIGADKLWGANLATAGEGMKIGIIDDGVDARHE